MKCPIDQTEMEEGLIMPDARGEGVAEVGDIFWYSGTSLLGLKKNNETKLVAFKCPKCGKVELNAKENN